MLNIFEDGNKSIFNAKIFKAKTRIVDEAHGDEASKENMKKCQRLSLLKLKFQFFFSDSYIDNSVTRGRFTLLATCR